MCNVPVKRSATAVYRVVTPYGARRQEAPPHSLSLAVDGVPPVISKRAGRLPGPRFPQLDRAIPGGGGENALRHQVPVRARHL